MPGRSAASARRARAAPWAPGQAGSRTTENVSYSCVTLPPASASRQEAQHVARALVRLLERDAGVPLLDRDNFEDVPMPMTNRPGARSTGVAACTASNGRSAVDADDRGALTQLRRPLRGQGVGGDERVGSVENRPTLNIGVAEIRRTPPPDRAARQLAVRSAAGSGPSRLAIPSASARSFPMWLRVCQRLPGSLRPECSRPRPAVSSRRRLVRDVGCAGCAASRRSARRAGYR